MCIRDRYYSIPINKLYLYTLSRAYLDPPLKVGRGHVTPIYRQVNVEIRTWRRFPNISNGRIWKMGLRSAMNMLHRVWMWFTTGCTRKLSMLKRCIVWIILFSTFTYIACMPPPRLRRVDTSSILYTCMLSTTIIICLHHLNVCYTWHFSSSTRHAFLFVNRPSEVEFWWCIHVVHASSIRASMHHFILANTF